MSSRESELLTTIAGLRAQLAEKQRSYDRLRAENQQLTAEKQQLQLQLDECQEAKARLEGEVKHLKEQRGSSAGSTQDAEAPAAPAQQAAGGAGEEQAAGAAADASPGAAAAPPQAEAQGIVPLMQRKEMPAPAVWQPAFSMARPVGRGIQRQPAIAVGSPCPQPGKCTSEGGAIAVA